MPRNLDYQIDFKYLDTLERNNRIDEILDIMDNVLLREGMGMTKGEVEKLRLIEGVSNA